MMDFLSNVLCPVTMTFAVSSMLAVELGYTIKKELGPLRDGKGDALVLIVNFALVPLLAFIISRLLSLDAPCEAGLLIVTSAAGAPLLIKLGQTGRHE